MLVISASSPTIRLRSPLDQRFDLIHLTSAGRSALGLCFGPRLLQVSTLFAISKSAYFSSRCLQEVVLRHGRRLAIWFERHELVRPTPFFAADRFWALVRSRLRFRHALLDHTLPCPLILTMAFCRSVKSTQRLLGIFSTLGFQFRPSCCSIPPGKAWRRGHRTSCRKLDSM